MIPMSKRIEIAKSEMRKGRGHYTISQLAESLQWSETTAQRVCNECPDLIRMLHANRKKKVERIPRVKADPVTLRPIIKHLHELIDESGMTFTEICEKSGLSSQFFRDVFKRGHLPRMDSMIAVCDVIGVELTLVKPDNA